MTSTCGVQIFFKISFHRKRGNHIWKDFLSPSEIHSLSRETQIKQRDSPSVLLFPVSCLSSSESCLRSFVSADLLDLSCLPSLHGVQSIVSSLAVCSFSNLVHFQSIYISSRFYLIFISFGHAFYFQNFFISCHNFQAVASCVCVTSTFIPSFPPFLLNLTSCSGNSSRKSPLPSSLCIF